MKKFSIIFVMLMICFFGFSTMSLAAIVKSPNDLSDILSQKDDHYTLKYVVPASTFPERALSFWKKWVNAFNGDDPSSIAMLLLQNDRTLSFFVIDSDYKFIEYSDGSGKIYPASSSTPFFGVRLTLSSDRLTYSTTVGISSAGSMDNIITSNIPNRISGIVISGHNKLSGNFPANFCYVDFGDKSFKISDDLGSFNVQHNLTINYQYANGTQAFETYTNTFSEGDSFSIPSPTLGGFKPSINTISGQMGNTDLLYTVTYTPINHSVTVNYQYENGSKALESYSGTFSEGQPYSIPTPAIKGYTPSLNIISGEMGTSDLSYTVIFTKAKEPDPPPSSSGNSSSENSGSSSSANGGYVVWNPSFMAKGFQNVSNMIGIAFNTFIWLFLGITGIFIIIKLVRHLFK